MTDIGPGEYWGNDYLARRGYRPADHKRAGRGAYRAPDLLSVQKGSVDRFAKRQTSSRSFQSGPMSTGLRSQPNQIFHYTV